MVNGNLFLKRLFHAYLDQTLTGEERKEFFRLVSDRKNEKELLELLSNQIENMDIPDYQMHSDPETIFKKIMAEAGSHEKENAGKKTLFLRKNSWWAVAAGLSLPLVFAVYLLVNNYRTNDMVQNEVSNITGNDILPGGNRAVLTLGDGGQIILDTASNGTITRQAGAQIIKSGSGQIEYQADNIKSEKIDYNTVSTPVGGQYQLTLSDGTKVWLNAASSVRFPATFSGKERKVFITGEIYFEVIPQYTQVSARKGRQKNIPFIVDVAGKGSVEVLGTHFNINSYTDEDAIKTTLLEGSVKFTPNFNPAAQNINDKGEDQKSVLINTGQQVLLAPDGQVQVKNDVNLEKVVAWKNGYFMFSSSSLQEVMNQIARWYDIEVIFEGTISDRKFGGKIQRDLNLSEALKILEKNNIHFKLEGRKLYIKS